MGRMLNRMLETPVTPDSLRHGSWGDCGSWLTRLSFCSSGGRVRIAALCIGLLTLVLGGCARPGHPLSANSTAPATVAGTHSLDEFQFDWPHTTVQDVEAKAGKPDRDLGSGIYILEYRLRDGSSILLGSSDNAQIMYVTHRFRGNERKAIYVRQ